MAHTPRSIMIDKRAPRNRTLTCSDEEIREFSQSLLKVDATVTLQEIQNKLILGDFFEVSHFLPSRFADLVILDPPYNISKDYHGNKFIEKSKEEYQSWFRNLLDIVDRLMNVDATIYVCSEWKTSSIIQPLLDSYFVVRNRITWERDKGRGSKSNWKNNAEDIWFCTKTEKYHFDSNAVKLKRKVLAPYREDGSPKDWREENGKKYRLTHPSNIWTDITVPFWSMPENTDHPTQKSEKLISKLVLASTKPGQFLFDPFVGSGTSAVVAKKLDRRWCGVDLNNSYLCWASKRIEIARIVKTIQGYDQGVFWERNAAPISPISERSMDELNFE